MATGDQPAGQKEKPDVAEELKKLHQANEKQQLENEKLRLENEKLSQFLRQAQLEQEQGEFNRRQKWSWWEKIIHRASIAGLLQLTILVVVLALVYFMVRLAYDRWQSLDDQPTVPGPVSTPVSGENQDAAPAPETQTEPTPDVQAVLDQAVAVLDDADRANDMAGQILSFLEAAGFLIALALGAAAIYGFRNARDTREEFQALSDDAREQVTRIEKVQHILDKLPDYDKRIDELPTLIEKQKNELEELIHVYTDLIQATEEMRLRNYQQAHRAAKRVLDHDARNAEALYIIAWLELQYIPGGTIERAREYVERVLALQPDSSAAKAAYGVILRRQALRLPEPGRTNLLNQAEGKLLDALGEDFNLIDTQLESYWAPVGGLRRDRSEPGDIEKAIQAYEMACRVTPGSSYPRGNLAALRLQQAGDDPKKREQALDTFEETLQLARVELALAPNDYFLMMDIFMSSLMLTQRAPSEETVKEAFERLDEALVMYGVTSGMMGVSLRGLNHLINHCPAEWDELRARLREAKKQLQEAIDAKIRLEQAENDKKQGGGKA